MCGKQVVSLSKIQSENACENVKEQKREIKEQENILNETKKVFIETMKIYII